MIVWKEKTLTIQMKDCIRMKRNSDAYARQRTILTALFIFQMCV